jgi:hypothetical protein
VAGIQVYPPQCYDLRSVVTDQKGNIMPGPCSAPNGQVSIVEKKRGIGEGMVKSGKTALKRGTIKHARKLSRARREEQEGS